jgi:hypothetical protein
VADLHPTFAGFIGMKMKTNCPRKGLLILFSLLASVILSPSEFVDCQSLFPDENLDFLGISKVSQKQSPVSSVSTLIASPGNPRYSWSHHLPFEVFSPQSINSGMALATVMRC